MTLVPTDGVTQPLPAESETSYFKRSYTDRPGYIGLWSRRYSQPLMTRYKSQRWAKARTNQPIKIIQVIAPITSHNRKNQNVRMRQRKCEARNVPTASSRFT